ncbi:MAG: FeoB-associated Cys-rich membrane protein [Oscillospiraceae bacterium]|nr:FeoB-associated Cys-rich membrane protein [Oscillospiraceae bacterium]
MPNLSTILVGLVVFGAFAAVIIRAIQNKKNGKGGCSCGCGDCPSKGLCHPEK